MKKVIAVSALAMAGMFSAQALADESKTGFYVTGKAGASVVMLDWPPESPDNQYHLNK